MSLQTRLDALITAVGTDIKTLRDRTTMTVPSGPTLRLGYLVLNAGDAVPSGTPTGTVILRRP